MPASPDAYRLPSALVRLRFFWKTPQYPGQSKLPWPLPAVGARLLRGEYIRKALNLTSWQAAADLVRGWEASGQIGVVRAEIPTIKVAVEKYIADGEARNLNAESSSDAVERLFLGFCTRQGYRVLKQLGVDELREFRNSLAKKYAASSAQTRLEYVRGFLRFCQASGWISANPALAVKPPRSDSSPTLPFDEADIETMLAAADTFTVKGNFGAGNRKRVRAMIGGANCEGSRTRRCRGF